jgi:hypothetical protein
MNISHWVLRELHVTGDKLERLQDRVYFVCFAALLIAMITGWVAAITVATYTLVRQIIS